MVIDGREAGYGGFSQVSNTKSVNSFSSDGDGGQQLTHLTGNVQYRAKMSYTYWVKQGNKFAKISSKNQALKIFSKQKQDVQTYLDSHKVDFDALKDVKDLMTYYYSL